MSHLDHDQRLDHLLLGLAVATLWLLHLGHWVIVSGRRHWLQANHRHDYSLFRLGRDYARRSQLCGWFVPICLNAEPDPLQPAPLSARSGPLLLQLHKPQNHSYPPKPSPQW